MRRSVARLELAASAVSFGLMAVLARWLSRGPGGFSAGQLSVVRFAIGVLVSLAAFRAVRGLYRPVNYRLLVTRGISGGLVVVLYFAALARIPAGDAGVLYNLFPVLATVMSIAAFGERPTGHLLGGLLLATSGVALVLGKGSFSFELGLGQAAALAAAVFAATSANVIRAMRPTENAPTIFFFFSLVGLPVVLPFALGPWPTAPFPWLVAVVMGLCAFAGQVLMTEAYGALTVAEAAVWLQLIPLAQALLAVPLLGEAVTPAELGGLVVAVAGVAWASLLGARRPGEPRTGA